MPRRGGKPSGCRSVLSGYEGRGFEAFSAEVEPIELVEPAAIEDDELLIEVRAAGVDNSAAIARVAMGSGTTAADGAGS